MALMNTLRGRRSRRGLALIASVALALGAAACGDDETAQTSSAPAESAAAPDDEPGFDCATVGPDVLAAPGAEVPALEGNLTVYSGRSEELVGPLLDCFAEIAGVGMDVRYTASSEEAAQLIDVEGDQSPADVLFSQSPGATGFLEQAGRLMPLPEDILTRVPAALVSAAGDWVGTSGRVRTLVYNTDEYTEAELPESVFDLTDPAWKGLVGVAPANGSFQDFVAAIIAIEGEDAAREWLDALAANDARTYDKNAAIVEAVGRGEVKVGLVNHYYALQLLANAPETPVANHFFADGDLGNLILAASVAVLDTAGDQQPIAEAFVRFLLSEPAQRYFVDTVKEYPAVEGIALTDGLAPLAELGAPDEDLNLLGGLLDDAVTLIEESGLADG